MTVVSPPSPPRARALALALCFALGAAPTACIQWVPADANRPSCPSLSCSACASHVDCAWCPASRACLPLAAAASCADRTHVQPSLCTADENAPADAQASNDSSNDSNDSSAPPSDGASCAATDCGACGDLAGCDWDTVDSVCRPRGTAPSGHRVVTSRADCATPGAVRVVNALAEPLPINVCFAPAGSAMFQPLFARFPGGRPPFAIDRYVRTQPLPVGPAGSYAFRFLPDGEPCTSARQLCPDAVAALASAETRWLVLFNARAGSRRVVNFIAQRPSRPERLSLRWFVARADTAAVSAHYDIAPGNTVTWTATGVGTFARNADSTSDGFTLLPAGAAASRPRATILPALVITSERALTTNTGAFTLLLASPPTATSLPGVFLALDESSDATSAGIL